MTDITRHLEESLEGTCTHCGEALEQWKYEINDESWHPGCWYESHGYEKVDPEEDRPYSSRADREFNHRRQRTTEICGETIEQERCAVLLTALESPEIAANQMDIEPATVREHIEQAQRKAIEGTEAYELLVSLGIIDDSE